MEGRIELVKSILENGKNKTWEDYAFEFNAENAKQANDWWRYHIKNPDYYAPDVPINKKESSNYDSLTLKSQWEAQGKGGEIITLKSWKNDIKGEDIEKFRRNLIKDMSEYQYESNYVIKETDSEYLAEISFPDFHIGRVDNETSFNVYNKTIKKVVDYLSKFNIDRILYILGNDFFNSDNSSYKTTNGTQQKDVGDFSSTMRMGIKIALDSIFLLKSLGVPVDIIIMPGNHDRFRAEALGFVLEGYFNNDAQVSIDNSLGFRKYYQYGKNGFMFEHGELKAEKYTALFATERPQMWADTEFRLVRLGHLHHHLVKETIGADITYLPSLSKNSRWEDSKGYLSKKRGFVYLHHYEEGEHYRITI